MQTTFNHTLKTLGNLFTEAILVAAVLETVFSGVFMGLAVRSAVLIGEILGMSTKFDLC
jgi:uncharacterized membrane-anchored protein YitT (DUF2179 family)